jgi:hypothetical protein
LHVRLRLEDDVAEVTKANNVASVDQASAARGTKK